MISSSAEKLIRYRLRFNWFVWMIFLILFCLHMFTGNEWERLAILVSAFALVEWSGPRSYRKALQGLEAYHSILKQDINSSSSFGLIFSCVLIEFFILFVVSVYLVRGLNI